MNTWRLALLGMRHYWRTHLGVVLGVMCGTAVLVGALAVGDSVRLSLRDQALQRIGRFDSALAAGDRFVTTELADRIAAALSTPRGQVTCAPVMQLPGVAASDGGDVRTGIVDVFGVDERFFAMSTSGTARQVPAPGHVLLNERLRRQLRVNEGSEILLRVEKPSMMPREATMATVDDVSFALRVTVAGALADDELGDFGLRASQVPPFNAFVSLAWLQQELALPGRANLLAVNADPDRANAALRSHWQLADAELRVRELPDSRLCELTSDRVFLDRSVGDAIRELDPGAVGVLTYFVNSIRRGEQDTPYSMVTALGRLGGPGEAAPAVAALLALVPANVASDQIVLNDWLARDLGAAIGDRVTLDFSVMGDALRLEDRSQTLRVHSIVELAGAAADPSLMPAFPGLAEARSCRDWEPGIPVELDRLDDGDQQYWDDHRGTPKAFVGLPTGQELWSNRFGSLTAVRTTADWLPRLEQELPRRLDPAAIGLFFQDLRGPALAAGAPATDFGGLFLGLSMFLIVAALLLTALLFGFGVEQRSREVGALLAFGFEPGIVRRMFLREAAVLATGGALVGLALGSGYAHAVIRGLGTLWRDAIGETRLVVHMTPTSLALGAALAIIASLGAIVLALRRPFRRPAVELLGSGSGIELPGGGGESGSEIPRRRGRILLATALVALLGAALLIATAGNGSAQAAGTFFGAGALLLLGGLLLCRWLLVKLGAPGRGVASVTGLGLRNAGRRPGRSLTVVALLASGTFLVVAIQANRLEPPRDASVRASGTGGFALFGRSTLPVLRDLDSAAAREAYALDEQTLQGVAIVPLRVRDGDDASCLNLSQAQNPRLVGIRAAALAQRGAFRFAANEPTGGDSPWRLLDDDFGPGVVPAIGDAASVTWALHKSIGDSVRYRDEQGREFDVRIVGTVTDSILQGNLVIAERHLQQRFPSATGYRMFLIDAPADREDQVAAALTRGLEDVGLELTETGERLAAFQAVQNTYLSMFQLLGALGLLLGTVGLGVVVLRNTLERRGELAVTSAVGFPVGTVRRLVGCEHALLLALGIGIGVIAALLAVQPVIRGPRALPIAPMVIVVVGIASSGAFWIWLASTLATRGRLLEALRQE